MSGLLEQLLERLNSIEPKLDAIIASHGVAVAVDNAAAPVVTSEIIPTTTVDDAAVAEMKEAPVADADGCELALSSNKVMIPYDERIHSSGKTRITSKGFWSRRKNISDEQFKAVEAELEAKVATPNVAPAPATTGVPAVPAATSIPTAPTAPGVPGVPAAPAPSVAPGVPGVPAAPAPTMPEKMIKAKLNESINKLTKIGIPSGIIIGELLTPYKVDTFDALTEQQAEEIVVLVEEGWLKYITLNYDVYKQMTALEQKHGRSDITTQVPLYLQQYNPNAKAIYDVPCANLSSLYDNLTGFLEQWKTFLGE